MGDKEEDLAKYIVKWLHDRNGGKFAKKLDSQSVADRENMLGELTLILKSGGRPPNWKSP